MNRRFLTTAAIALAAGACVEEQGTELLTPVALEFSWQEAYDGEQDGLAAVVPFDVVVYDRTSGEPVPGTVIELRSDDVGLVGEAAVGSAAPGCSACVWDAYSDAYVELSDAGAPGSLDVMADDNGIVRVHAVVDTLNGEASIEVSAEGLSETIPLRPW